MQLNLNGMKNLDNPNSRNTIEQKLKWKRRGPRWRGGAVTYHQLVPNFTIANENRLGQFNSGTQQRNRLITFLKYINIQMFIICFFYYYSNSQCPMPSYNI